VNRFGLVYTIQGSVNSLRPIVFTAHQDVVPVQADGTWKYPPFKPYYDGHFLWGRGAVDCKNNLIGILSAVEALLSQEQWKPKRTVIVAFGFDEEVGGANGAAHIAAELEKTWGSDGIEWILDEGGMGLVIQGDAIYALPAVHEKSYLDVYIDLEIEGGHSSRPPSHSGVGIVSEMAVALEAHPYRPLLVGGSPYYKHLVCQATYSPDTDPWLKDALKENKLEYISERMSAQDRDIRFRIQTSQAIDIIQGGGKINALPEAVTLGINYRIAPQDSMEAVKENVAKYVKPIAEKYGLTVVSFDGTVLNHSESVQETETYRGTIHLRQGESTPRTPISPTANNVWNEFAATVRHVFSDYANTVVPVGDIMTGNTDTRHYWSLTENIYRWSPARIGTRLNAHTVDERLDMSAHIDGLRLYYGK
jgi:Gly-Xaa carboxypeptidase